MLLEVLPTYLGAAAPGGPAATNGSVPAALGSVAGTADVPVLWQFKVKLCPSTGGMEQAAKQRSCVFLGNRMTCLVWVTPCNCTHYPALSAALHK